MGILQRLTKGRRAQAPTVGSATDDATDGGDAAPPAAPGFAARTVTHTYHGVPLTLYLADDVGALWYDLDWPDIPEVDFLGERGLRSGATVFDVGAHQGVYALLFADRVGAAGKVVAVEANGHNAAVLGENKRLNEAGCLEVLHRAGGDVSGFVEFGRGSNGQVDDTGAFADSERVEVVTIDQLARQYGPPDVLFVDVEGYECHVLRGAAETLDRRPDCCIEVHVNEGLEHFGETAATVLDFFPRDAFELFISNETVRQPWPLGRDKDKDEATMADRFFLLAAGR